MRQRLDNVWFGLLRRAHRWIACRIAECCQREMVRRAKGRSRGRALRRLERHLACQNPHLN